MTTIDPDILPEAGDLVWVDFRPTLGREQSGVRPAVVLSSLKFHRVNETAIVCPIAGNVKAWPTEILLPEELAVSSAALTDQIRCVDRAARGFRRVGSVPPDILIRIRLSIAEIIGITTDLQIDGAEP